MLQSDVTHTFVCGYAGSGKTTYAKSLSEFLGAGFVEVSDIVKKLSNLNTRSELTQTQDLDSRIIEELRKVPTPVVICGARQLSIVKAFPNSQVMWFALPFEQRHLRLTSRASNKDNIDLHEADELDNKLGLAELAEHIIAQGSN